MECKITEVGGGRMPTKDNEECPVVFVPSKRAMFSCVDRVAVLWVKNILLWYRFTLQTRVPF